MYVKAIEEKGKCLLPCPFQMREPIDDPDRLLPIVKVGSMSCVACPHFACQRNGYIGCKNSINQPN